LSRTAQGLEVRLRARGRVPLGTAGRNLWLPGAAIALGQGLDPGRYKAAAVDFALQAAVAGQSRGLLPPDSEYRLPADDRGQPSDAAGDDRAFLYGLVRDAVDRPAP